MLLGSTFHFLTINKTYLTTTWQIIFKMPKNDCNFVSCKNLSNFFVIDCKLVSSLCSPFLQIMILFGLLFHDIVFKFQKKVFWSYVSNSRLQNTYGNFLRTQSKIIMLQTGVLLL